MAGPLSSLESSGQCQLTSPHARSQEEEASSIHQYASEVAPADGSSFSGTESSRRDGAGGDSYLERDWGGATQEGRPADYKTASRVFQSLPGQMTVTEHRIVTGEARPVRLAPYRIPHALRQDV